MAKASAIGGEVREYEWDKWVLQTVQAGRSILRLSLIGHMSEMAVHAMVIQPAKGLDEVEKLGIIWYNNQPNPHVSINRAHQLQFVVCSDPARWDSFLLMRGPKVDDWQTEATTLCLWRDMFDRDGFKTISSGSLLAMEYLARFTGMIHQAWTTSREHDTSIVLAQADKDLERLLYTKRRDIASLVAGL